MKTFSVTVVIPTILTPTPTYNRLEDLRRCLNSLANQTFKDFEVLIVDNSPIADMPATVKEMLKALERKIKIRIIRDSTKNLAHVFNTGWRNTPADIVAHLNDDAEAESEWLDNIVDTFSDLRANLVGGPTIATREQEMLSLYKKEKSSRLLAIFGKLYDSVVLQRRLFDIGALCETGAYSIGGSLPFSTNLRTPIEVDLLTITNMAVSKKVLKKLGGFDENFLFAHFDGDFFIRAKKAGYKLIFNPRVVVLHHVNPSGSTRSAYYRGRDSAYFYLKSIRPKSLQGWIGYLLNIAYFNAYWLYKTWVTKNVGFLAGIRGFFDGFRHYLSVKLYDP